MDEAPPAWPPLPDRAPEVLDREHWQRLQGTGGGSLLSDFMRLYCKEEPARIARLRELEMARNGHELARCAHTVAGSCAMLGAREIQAAAAGLERAAAAEAWPEVARRRGELEAAWERLKAELGALGFRL